MFRRNSYRLLISILSGGLKFNDGEVDIEPIILYRFARQEREQEESTLLPIGNVREAQIPLWRKSTAPCAP